MRGKSGGKHQPNLLIPHSVARSWFCPKEFVRNSKSLIYRSEHLHAVRRWRCVGQRGGKSATVRLLYDRLYDDGDQFTSLTWSRYPIIVVRATSHRTHTRANCFWFDSARRTEAQMWAQLLSITCTSINERGLVLLLKIQNVKPTVLLYYINKMLSYRRETALQGALHTVSQKNIPNVFSYNSRKHWQIFITFGRNVTEKASNHTLLYFSTSPN